MSDPGTLPAQGAERVGAVAVCHLPDRELLRRGLAATAPQVARIVVVDNGSDESEFAALRAALAHVPNAEFLRLNTNLGVAAAQNAGLRHILQAGLKYALLLDQDSVPAPDMVARLVRALDALQARGDRVAAVGPIFVDRKLGEAAPFVRFRGLWLERRRCGYGNEVVPTDFLISSGSLLSLGALPDIGFMNEALFIEHVDTEWCLRALRRGWRLCGVCDARLEHDRGEAMRRYWLGRWHFVPQHPPVRHYYLVRNGVYLLVHGRSPLRSLLPQALKLAQALVLYTCLGPERTERLRVMLLGAWHGFRGRLGPR